MPFISLKTVFEVLAEVWINLTSGWFGIVIVTPGFLGTSIDDYIKLLTINLPQGILG